MALKSTTTQGDAPASIAGLPGIEGAAVEGEVLTAIPAAVTGTPTPTTSYVWKRSGTPISGATASTYTLVSADVDDTITVVQTAANKWGSASAESAATSVVQVPTVLPDGTASIVIANSPDVPMIGSGYEFAIALGPEFVTPAPLAPEVYNRRDHEIYYFWDFGAGAAYDFTAPTNVDPLHKRARYAYGSKAAFVPRAAGTHTITCRVVEPASGIDTTATIDVTIPADATVFSTPAQTVILSSTGSGLAGYPSATIVTSLSALFSHLSSLTSETVPVQVLVRRGQTFSTGAAPLINSKWPSVIIKAADEAGAKPIFSATAGWTINDRNSAVPQGTKALNFQNIRFVGPWDSVTETGATITMFNAWSAASGASAKPPRQFVFDQCEFDGFANIFATANNMPYKPAVYLSDTLVTNWQNYGILPNQIGLLACIGSAIYQNPLANAGGEKPNYTTYQYPGPFNNHTGVRLGQNADLIIHSCDFMSRNDWNTNGGTPTPGPFGGQWGQQPNVRYDTDGVGGGYCNIQASVFEGGNNVIALTEDQNSIAGKVSNIIIEKNYFLGSHNTRKVITCTKGGTTIRNNVLVIPDVPTFSSWAPSVGIELPADLLDADNTAAPQRIYSNTIINHSTSAVTAVVTSGFTDVVSQNNLFYQPNASPVTTADGPLDTTQAFTSRQLGYKHNSKFNDGQDTLDTDYATPSSQIWTGAPLTGSDALGDATTGLVAFDDFYGNERPATKDRGAIQVST